MFLFVYGTLKKGKCNHYKMQPAKFLCEAYITGYQLHQAPAITPKEGGIVHGELYEIDDALLKTLDAFEGHNEQSPQHSLYRRTSMKCHDSNAESTPCSVYVYNRPIYVPINPTGVY